MIEAAATVRIDADIDNVWGYVREIQNWAGLMPGMRECTVIDANESRWLLKVGVGGLVRTVTVLVRVDQWEGPVRVDFSYRLDGDPVEGSGFYLATASSERETDVTLHVSVVGSGPMAPMWEAVSRPLLPQLAKAFAGKLKAEIEESSVSRESCRE